MNKKWLFIIASVLIVIVAGDVLHIKMQPAGFFRHKGQKQFNYALITVNTLRADRIGCYGYPDIEAPFIDFFVRRGIKYDRLADLFKARNYKTSAFVTACLLDPKRELCRGLVKYSG